MAAPRDRGETPGARRGFGRESFPARWRRLASVAAAAGFCWLITAGPAHAQLGSLLSPGRLSKPHSHLEGIRNCTKCHERGRGVTAQKCLSCHKPIAERMARKMGVHRNVTTGCESCHAEHAGVDAQLGPFDQAAFDHAGVARFPLVGKHAPIAKQCAACHKERSFLTLKPACASCHEDVHKGSLGNTCTSCHSVQRAFGEARTQFDHSKARFPLAGAHKAVACENCHTSNVFSGLKFSTCADCHRDPHRGAFSPTCTTCHADASWSTRKVDHSRTAFPLVGRHSTVACALCHKQPAMRVKSKSDTCASCHADPHRGAFKQDCGACHTETGFAKAPFDHAQTDFPLVGGHRELTCRSCHKTVVTAGLPASKRVADFRGLNTACASCHADVHRGELGQACESCHSPETFRVKTFTHPRFPEFFAGQHRTASCAQCHTRGQKGPAAAAAGARVITATFKDTPRTCARCHDDVHLGQVGSDCQTCHSIQLPNFALDSFSHATRTRFPLTGRHEAVACQKCHERETGAFPSGTGTAVRLKGVARECRGCHTDVHLGQFTSTCDTCHNTATFELTSYEHRNGAWLEVFVGRHARAACESCHKPVAADFPGGRGTAVRFKVDTRCVTCHEDVHRGALGSRCIECHRP